VSLVTLSRFQPLQWGYRTGVSLADPSGVRTTRLPCCQYWPRWRTALWLCAGLIALVAATGCRRGVPVIDNAPKPAVARGTITGIVRGPADTSGIPDRTVTATNIETGERHQARTNSNGGFTLEAMPGKYRLQVELHAGESLVKGPDVVTLDRGDIDSHIEFIVSTARVARPRGPAYHVDNGLGSPIA
jgi:hypothetical protein